MVVSVQCDNCGAVLTEDDLFCGECGVPRPSSDGRVESSADASPPPLPVGPSPVRTADAPGSGWRVATIVLAVLGACICLAAVSLFLFMGILEYESMTAQEAWLFSAFCCLLPIGGGGAILLITAVALWYGRLRSA